MRPNFRGRHSRQGTLKAVTLFSRRPCHRHGRWSWPSAVSSFQIRDLLSPHAVAANGAHLPPPQRWPQGQRSRPRAPRWTPRRPSPERRLRRREATGNESRAASHQSRCPGQLAWRCLLYQARTRALTAAPCSSARRTLSTMISICRGARSCMRAQHRPNLSIQL